MSVPSNCRQSAWTMPGAPIRPISAIMVSDLPEPDSPTMASTSPLSTLRSRPATNGTAEPKRTDRSRMFSRLIPGSLLRIPQVRVDRIPQAVTYQVAAQDTEQDDQAGQRHHPPGTLDVVARRGQHGAPLGGWRLHAEAEKAQRGGIENRRGKAQSGLHDQRRHAVGQYGDEHQPWQAGTGQLRGSDVVAVQLAHHRRTG